ncbi:uncharacterized protein [Branchiostoma lanceolatum]|uniref:uncharacterized protein n=1 Tax=Branchiostoma lanceolatum TaxID=7740 RepID=UPI0034573097
MSSPRRDVTVLVPLCKESPDKEEDLRKCPTVEVKNVIFNSIGEKENLMDYVQRLKKVVKENNVNVVLPTTDLSTFVHAALARDFPHIPGPSVESCYLAFHKPYTRQYLDLAETTTPYDALDLDSPTLFQDVERTLEKVGLPAFVKSGTATLAYGLKKIENYDDLKDALVDFKTMRDEHPDFMFAPSAAFYRQVDFCPFCPNEIEDEQHFILDFPRYHDKRSKLFKLLSACSTDSTFLSIDKFKYILEGDNPYCVHIGKYIKEC